MKLNTYRVVKHRENKASYGVLIKDANDRWLIGFVKNLSSYGAFVAKYWVMVSTLQLAWNMGFKEIQME